ncbi:MAG: hypothetical protein K2H17_06140 [Duncaniella sp.]|uniref:hypothetical protein n=1 Tax=Duncaniella sp. TaxID=2518496 RepID=UPI0023C1EEA4|nr:hypothetical protein [Duncaniella sp.]MDE5988959.1 hypothetical protein [Duncaniella sp.]
MEQKIKNKVQPSGSQQPEINKPQEVVKAAHLSSNPINGRMSNNGTAHFEVEVANAFFRVFNL